MRPHEVLIHLVWRLFIWVSEMVRTEVRKKEFIWDWAFTMVIVPRACVLGLSKNHVIILFKNLAIGLILLSLVASRLWIGLNQIQLLKFIRSLLPSLFHRKHVTNSVIEFHFILLGFSNVFLDLFLAFLFQQDALASYKLLYPVVSLLGLGYQCGERPVHAFVVFEEPCFSE